MRLFFAALILTHSAAALQKWSLREGGRGCCRRFPPDIHHFSPTYSCYNRDGDYSIAGITDCILPYRRQIQLTDFFSEEGVLFLMLIMCRGSSVLQLSLG